ncbi:MAG: hypothetical protein A2921_01085 [Candidatus Magasanikbacteria bacterium RIFCSPLOWO2_01_FULL_43_20b]|uniref:Uncharacterized protein n=1 Tax=Candidatus Magasanikbacteria bacterium RIFCSPLOWO2_12_FULL_43_12 TaxID=1798692 RepID=A0A1F6MVE8_9BACT|nr:MAG: hypothetical protein A3I93_00215 [Candidatus Magasanikbacteria bacterium RIFCSPLOWO2_02_FULL_43_22]OGH72049.1 MAG: hypothetical protein A3C74_01275 [Candidatus Magasanikbacteria bacterium RIFCSPHIGHO2_02_FULL_44_13]OGH72991.1 MAG: hypothetical protein A2921_01085 [Candidatus Magasanikbacteria bacterium RIFCSPLOWO2_01_FULL_43_20b]OGH75581.1 MAG: hypothetical protein A3G00_00380 [Candidatus Magasanikbacteria bacterium RIFCSPLOWO2_12_FULL_43_12]
MPKNNYDQMKSAVLSHVQSLFDEMEKEMALSHQEKYALLEDALENATDEHELRVAFDQWHAEHAEDLGFEENAGELWLQALGEKGADYGGFKVEDKDEDGDTDLVVEDNFDEDEEEPKDDYNG